MPSQAWRQPIGPGGGSVVHTADGASLNTSVALTDINPTPHVVIPANALYVGNIWKVTAWGRVGTTGTPTLLLGVYWGGVAGTAVCTTGAITTTSGVTTVPWRLECYIICRSVGSSGTIIGQGWVHGISGTVGVSVVPMPASAPATVTVDTTAAKAVTIGAQWGTSNASNAIIQHGMLVEAVN